MVRYLAFFLIGLGLTLCGRGIAQILEPFDYLFESGTEGYACFRIPAIVTTTEGTVLAFAEGRKKGCSDTGDIDLVMKRSEDNGQTWTKLMVIRDEGEQVCGNPAPVGDKLTGAIHLLSTWNLGEDHERDIIEGKSHDTRLVFVMSSTDEGLSWSEPREITASVKQENWTWYATGPCHGIQLKRGAHKGRLLIPCDHIEAGTKKCFSHSIYSDDQGQSWKLGGSTPLDQVNECTMAELSDGKVMLNMRNYDRSQKTRKVSISADGGLTWGPVFSDTSLIEPICQASMLMVIAEAGKKHTLLFLNPADENKRQNMTLLFNGNLGCFYEAGNSNSYEGLVFQEFPWQNIEQADY